MKPKGRLATEQSTKPERRPPVAATFLAACRHHRAGRLSEAESLYRQALAADPHHAGSLHMLGVLAHQTGRDSLAVDSITRAIAINPTVADYHANLGMVLGKQNRLDEAVAACRNAVALNPEFPAGHNNLGLALKEQGLLEDAAACLRTTIRLAPDNPPAHNNLGNVLKQQGDLQAATSCYRTAIDLRPGYAAAHNNLGIALRDQGLLDEAVASLRQATSLRPDDADAHANLAVALLTQGDMAAGWPEFEWRWKTPQLVRGDRRFSQPQWRGEPAAGQTLLIHAEQGFGDTIQFCRFAPHAAARGLRTVMEVQPPLVRLLRGIPGVDRVLARGDALPAFDLHCPMLSMPLALGATLATVPSAPSYLHPDPDAVAGWRARLAAMPQHGPRVGLAWAGNPRRQSAALAAADRRRSIAPERLAPLFDLPGVHFFSLQRDGPAPPDDLPITDFMAEMADFDDTAALVATLDLVIAVDTAVAHLAAALGKPVWVMDRFDSCWRWLTGRRDSPWYPTLRLYRQPHPGDWDSVLAGITHDLGAWPA